jgi:hypothetical protein
MPACRPRHRPRHRPCHRQRHRQPFVAALAIVPAIATLRKVGDVVRVPAPAAEPFVRHWLTVKLGSIGRRRSDLLDSKR